MPYDLKDRIVMGAKLFAPVEFWHLWDADHPWIVKMGCGPGGTGDKFVPDTFWGLSVRPICKIHDMMYQLGENDEDRYQADSSFLENLRRWIEARSRNFILKKLRMIRAMTYYTAVRIGGKSSFYADKEESK